MSHESWVCVVGDYDTANALRSAIGVECEIYQVDQPTAHPELTTAVEARARYLRIETAMLFQCNVFQISDKLQQQLAKNLAYSQKPQLLGGNMLILAKSRWLVVGHRPRRHRDMCMLLVWRLVTDHQRENQTYLAPQRPVVL